MTTRPRSASAQLGLVVEHAWCVGPTGRIYDPTWCGPGRTKGKAYFGVAVPNSVLRRVIVATRHYGIFSQWFDWKKVLRIVEEEMPELKQEKAA